MERDRSRGHAGSRRLDGNGGREGHGAAKKGGIHRGSGRGVRGGLAHRQAEWTSSGTNSFWVSRGAMSKKKVDSSVFLAVTTANVSRLAVICSHGANKAGDLEGTLADAGEASLCWPPGLDLGWPTKRKSARLS